MRSPVIYSTTGAVLSSDEIAFAHHVAASFSHQTKPDYVKIVRRTDPTTGASVEYHLVSNIAYVTPGGAVDYVAVRMPNPVPYRGVSVGMRDRAGQLIGFVMTSDGIVLASEIIGTSTLEEGVWNGEGYVNMYLGGDLNVIDHQLLFTVPEDCIYPAPATPSVVFNDRRKAWLKKNSDETVSAMKIGFTVDAARQQLRSGLPHTWDRLAKKSCRESRKTYRPSPMTVISGPSYTMGAYDTGATGNWFVNFECSVTLGYTDSAGVQVSQTFTGAVHIEGELHFTPSSENLQTSAKFTYTDFPVTDLNGEAYPFELDFELVPEWTTIATWFPPLSARVVGKWLNQHRKWDQYHAIVKDGGESLFGLLNGVYTSSYYVATSQTDLGYTDPNGDTRRPDLSVTMALGGKEWATELVPAMPDDAGTPVFSHPPFITAYHQSVLPEYKKGTPTTITDGSDDWNSSALYGVTEIDLSPIGCVTTESLGMFAHPDATSNAATKIELYGTAVYTFDWASGALVFESWKPLLDTDGNEVASKVIDLPAGETWGSLGTNCLITYRGLHWPDVKEYIKLRNTDMNSGTFAFTTPGFKALVDAVKAG